MPVTSRFLAKSALLCALGLLLPCTPVAAEGLYAARIDADNAAQLQVGGPDAIGGVGDWAIGNGTLCAVVSDPSHEAILSDRGGVLVDLAHCGRDDDQWNALHSLMNLSRSGVVAMTEVDARLDHANQRATITSRGTRNGAEVTTRFVLSADAPNQLSVTTTVVRREPGDRVFLLGDIAIHGHRQLSGFALSTRSPDVSTGFHHAELDPYDPLEMLAAIVPADTQVLVGGDRLEPGISYAVQVVSARLQEADGTWRPVRTLTVNGEDFSMIGVFARPFWIGADGDIGVLALAQSLLMDLSEGEKLVVERIIHVGDRADVASVTDAIFAEAPRVSGRLSDPEGRIHVQTESGAPVTFVRPRDDGSFSFLLPTGKYQLSALAPAGRRLDRDFEVKRDTRLGELSVGAITRVQLPRGKAMRLSFVPAEGGLTPQFDDDLSDFRIGGQRVAASTESRHVSLAGVPSDPRSVQLAPGRYDVYASRGLEHDVKKTSFVLSAGETKRLRIQAPEPALRTSGWIGADLHVHSEWSDDSALPSDWRLRSFVAQGGEVMGASEHDNVYDFAPRIREIGLGQRLVALTGGEVTSTSRSNAAPTTFGHANVFPLTPDPLVHRRGVPLSEGRRLRDLVWEMRLREPNGIVQLNHARPKGEDEESDGAFLSHLSKATPFDPTTSLLRGSNASLVEADEATGVRDIDFDVMELMNGESMLRYRRIRADWFALLLQGEVRAATANSDSHDAGTIVSLPQNYVRQANDSVRTFDQSAFLSALKSGKSYGTTGPILGLVLAGKSGKVGIGDVYQGSEGELQFTVRAAPWVDVSEVRIFVDGDLVYGGNLDPGETQSLPLSFERDAFVTVEVEGEPGEVYQAVAPGFVPFAFTNPIFVDADSDGKWTAPGLPDELPDTITQAN